MKSRIGLRHTAILALGALSLAAAPAASDDPAAEDTTTEVTSTEDAPTDDTSSQDTQTAEAEATGEESSEPDSSATAVEVEDVIVISQATASDDSASATVLELGGERVVGGEADGGSSSGAILDSGETELGRLAVGPWSAETSDDGSNSQASVAEVTVIDEDTFYAHVLRSRAAADANGGTSASSDAVVIGIAGEDEIRVLSSTWTADGPESALVRHGDETYGQDTDGQCQFEVPELVNLLCLTGADGQGGELVPGDNEDLAYASGAEVVLVGEQGAAALRAGGQRSDQPDAATSDDAHGTAESPSPSGGDDRELAAAPNPEGVGDGSLPRTGGGLALGALGLLLLAAGLVLRRRAELAA